MLVLGHATDAVMDAVGLGPDVPVGQRRLALHRRGPRPLPRRGLGGQRARGALVGHRRHRQAAVDLARAVGRRTAPRHRGGARRARRAAALRPVPRRGRRPSPRGPRGPTGRARAGGSGRCRWREGSAAFPRPGGRFSANACAPSRWSADPYSVATVGNSLVVIRRMASAKVRRWLSRCTSLIAAKTSGGPAGTWRPPTRRARTACRSVHLVDQAPAVRLGGVHPPAGEQQLHRDVVGHPGGKPQRRRVGQGARVDLRERERALSAA